MITAQRPSNPAAPTAAWKRRVSLLFSEEERRRFLSERAAMWRREIRLLAVLTRTGPADTRTAIRSHDEAVAAILSENPSSPGPARRPRRAIWQAWRVGRQHRLVSGGDRKRARSRPRRADRVGAAGWSWRRSPRHGASSARSGASGLGNSKNARNSWSKQVYILFRRVASRRSPGRSGDRRSPIPNR